MVDLVHSKYLELIEKLDKKDPADLKKIHNDIKKRQNKKPVYENHKQAEFLSSGTYGCQFVAEDKKLYRLQQ